MTANALCTLHILDNEKIKHCEFQLLKHTNNVFTYEFMQCFSQVVLKAHNTDESGFVMLFKSLNHSN